MLEESLIKACTTQEITDTWPAIFPALGSQVTTWVSQGQGRFILRSKLISLAPKETCKFTFVPAQAMQIHEMMADAERSLGEKPVFSLPRFDRPRPIPAQQPFSVSLDNRYQSQIKLILVVFCLPSMELR
jgi:hypothetical protein